MVQQLKCAGIACVMRSVLQESGLTDEALESVERHRDRYAYRRGEVVFSQGERSKGLYCLQSGHILLWHSDVFGKRTGFRVVGPGEIMGYRSLFGTDLHAATAEVLSTCNICRYSSEKMLDLARSNAAFGMRIVKLLAHDRGPPDALLLRAPHVPVRTRLVRLLVILGKQYGERRENGELAIKLPLLRRDIALLIGARHESVTRAIKELERDSIASFNQDTVTVSDPELLFRESKLEAVNA